MQFLKNDDKSILSSFLNQLKEYINEWFKTSNDICRHYNNFFNSECDMQVRLARYLQEKNHFSEVLPEYKVPLKELAYRLIPLYGMTIQDFNPNNKQYSPFYPWKNNISVDLVVKNNEGEFALIEIKYATKSIKGGEIFGVDVMEDTSLIKSHDAYDIIMYNFWKDVRRIEVISKAFEKVIGGFAIMLTNNCLWNPSNSQNGYKDFEIFDSRKIYGKTNLNWGGSICNNITENHPSFLIEGNYECFWRDSGMNFPEIKNGVFRYMMLPIEKKLC